ncbi:ABC superfamily ATP binding cassette transporter, ABC protein, partial [human gut metagenome]
LRLAPEEVFGGHREELKAAGVWLPSAYRDEPRQTALPALKDPSAVGYLQRDGQEWTQVEALGSDEPDPSLDAVSV